MVSLKKIPWPGLICVTGLLLAGIWVTGCQASKQRDGETAVPPHPRPSSPSQLFLPVTQNKNKAEAALPVTAPPPSPIPPETSFCNTPGRVTQGSLQSQWAGELSYRIYFPPCYGEYDRTYPTLYLLPGNVHTDSIWQDLGVTAAADVQMLSGTLPPFLIVMADGGWLAQNSSGGPGSFESVILAELIPHIEATTCAWAAARGRAIGGLSRGGYWSLEIAFRHPATFAGVGGHSAALVDSYAWPEVNPRSTGLTLAPGALEIYLDIGQDDYLLPPLLELHENMQRLQIPHTWLLNAGGHEEAYWAANIPAYLAWYASLWPNSAAEMPLCNQ